MELIDRPRYAAWLDGFRDKPVAKVLTGMRRSGKSTILELTARRLRESGVTPERIAHFNFDRMGLAHLRSAEALDQHLDEILPADGPFYLLLDEVQEVDGWERLVNSRIAEGRADIYLTGSNSRLLSSDLATYIAGRYVSLEVSTLSFAEHLSFAEARGGSAPLDRALEFDRYLRWGGLPGIHADYDDHQVEQLVRDIYGAILVRDVLVRHRIRNAELFERVALFALDNVGNLFSARRVSEFLKSQRKPLAHQTVADYLAALTEAFLLAKVSRQDLRGRALLATGEKYFAGDHGIVNAVFGFDAARLPGLLENLVWAELRRRGYTVHVGKLDRAEVDFVADRQDHRLYIQVAATVLDPETRRREFAPLMAIRDSHPKYVLSLDRLAAGATNGVRHAHLPDFLLDESWSA
jgi:predicted AAA+ superfamily ATPase